MLSMNAVMMPTFAPIDQPIVLTTVETIPTTSFFMVMVPGGA